MASGGQIDEDPTSFVERLDEAAERRAFGDRVSDAAGQFGFVDFVNDAGVVGNLKVGEFQQDFLAIDKLGSFGDGVAVLAGGSGLAETLGSSEPLGNGEWEQDGSAIEQKQPQKKSSPSVAEQIEDENGDDEGKDGWDAARAWLWTLPRRRNVLYEEVEEWLQSNKDRLSREIVTMPRAHLFRFFVAQHKLMRRTDQMENLEVLEPPTARFRRSDKWKPVYAWLESLNLGSVVGAKVIDAWLENNPALREELLGKHTRHHLFHYIQKCHTNIIKKKKKEVLNGPMRRTDEKKKKKKKKTRKAPKPGGLTVDGSAMLSRPDATIFGHNKAVYEGTKLDISTFSTMTSDGFMQLQRDAIQELRNIQLPTVADWKGIDSVLSHQNKKPALLVMDKAEARRRYEILSELQTQLLDQIVHTREQIKIASAQGNAYTSDWPSTSAVPFGDEINRPGSSGAVLGSAFDNQNMGNEDSEGRLRRRSRDSARFQQENASMRSRSYLDLKSAKKRRKGKDKFHKTVLSWSYSEVVTGNSGFSRSEHNSHFEKGPHFDDPSSSEKALSSHNTVVDEVRQPKMACSPVKCLQERERGAGIGYLLTPFQTFGRGRCHRWKSLVEGWDSLEKQFTGCAVWLQRRAFSTWLPCWSAYTSSVAVAAPLGTIDQGVQKVLDVRFHPNNLPQLVCSSNAAPNELLLYDLLSGKATELVGHNCQIQAVEFAADGGRIVSCGSNLVKIWDSITGACLHTLGPGPWDENACGHRKKINAMAVNQKQSYLVATSGGHGDSQVLLWNINRGELTCDLNGNLRNQSAGLPCMDALEFCDQSLLICGSDSSGGPAIVQIWDVQAPESVTSFPANDSYITSLKANPAGTIIASGAGDGSVALFDIRTCGGIVRLPLGSSCEVTSVSFSSCGTFLQASSTANKTIVWDTRMLPMDPGPRPIESPLQLADSVSRKIRALHCLSHGTPMPTSENAGQMPGVVDEGDQGVNDARWFHADSVLVTASGNGSIAMWDMSLGDPCIRHMTSHTRCVNTVAISPNDRYICSGGDDQKVVLYQNTRDKSTSGWRLMHPLLEEPPID